MGLFDKLRKSKDTQDITITRKIWLAEEDCEAIQNYASKCGLTTGDLLTDCFNSKLDSFGEQVKATVQNPASWKQFSQWQDEYQPHESLIALPIQISQSTDNVIKACSVLFGDVYENILLFSFLDRLQVKDSEAYTKHQLKAEAKKNNQ